MKEDMYGDIEEDVKEESIYAGEVVDDMVEEDSISPAEAGFMQGYIGELEGR